MRFLEAFPQEVRSPPRWRPERLCVMPHISSESFSSEQFFEEQKETAWWWPLLIGLLLFVCLATVLLCDEDWQKRAKGLVQKGRRGRASERQPLTGSGSPQQGRLASPSRSFEFSLSDFSILSIY